MARQRAILFGAVAALLLGLVVVLVLSARQRARDDARNLEATLAFADRAECLPGEPLARILRDMYRIGPEPESPPGAPAPPFPGVRAGPPIAVPGFADPLRPRLGRYPRSDEISYTHYSILDLRGRWHGLKVTGLNSDPIQFRIHFDERPERIRAVLARAGFRPSPEDALTPGSPLYVLRERNGDASLSCIQARMPA